MVKIVQKAKKQNRLQNAANVLNDETQKTYPGDIKTNNSGETDKPRGSLSRENLLICLYTSRVFLLEF